MQEDTQISPSFVKALKTKKETETNLEFLVKTFKEKPHTFKLGYLKDELALELIKVEIRSQKNE
jgi:hypothetical protein